MNPVTRAALLSTTALVLVARAPALADITINANTNSTQVPTAAENVTVTNTGSITLTSPGIYLDGVTAGSITVETSGSINATGSGIWVHDSSGLSGGIINSGKILGDALGIQISNDSIVDNGITNVLGATISGSSSAGITLYKNATVNGGITNHGKIFGSSTGAIVNSYTSTITGGILNSGTISGQYGITSFAKSTITGGINNGGKIIGINVGVENWGTSTISGGINNSGTISGDTGFRSYLSELNGGITNSGNIIGSTTGIDLWNNSTINDGITNEAGGIISGGSVGIYNRASSIISGGIANSGLISGSSFAGIANMSTSTISGGINNSGTIFGSSVGIGNASSSSISGGINNSGTISSASVGIGNAGFATIIGGINNSGIISGGSAGIGNIFSSTIAGGINNSGSISGKFGISNHGSTITGGITNEAGATISGTGFAIGAILNLGSATISGGIHNNGTISDGSGGITNAVSSTIEDGIYNNGLISAAARGINNDAGSTVNGGITNDVDGTITAHVGIYISANSIVDGGITNAGQIIGTGGTAIQFGDADDVLTLQTGSRLTGTSDGSAGDDTLNLEGAGSEDDTFTNFEQLNMNGTDWTLSGDLTLLSGGLGGDVNINSGVLYMNGMLTAPGGVNATGTLAGTGTLVGDLNLGAGSTLAPGNSIGIMNTVGDVSFLDGSSFDVEVEGTLADRLNVDGNVTINPDAVLNVIPLSGGIDVQDQTIVLATGTIDADFQTVNSNGLIVSTALIGGNEIVLNAISPTWQSANVQTSTQNGFGFQNTLVGGRPQVTVDGSDDHIWMSGFDEQRERDSVGDFAGFEQDTEGRSFGADHQFNPDLRLGFAYGHSLSQVDQIANSGETEIRTTHYGLYGIYQKESVTFSLGAQVGIQDLDFKRPVLLSGTLTNVTGTTDGSLVGLSGRASWGHELISGWSAHVNLNAGYVHQSQDGFVDASGVHIADIDTETLRAGPSLDVAGNIEMGSVSLRPSVSAGWQGQWMSGDESVEVTFGNGGAATAALEDVDDGFATLSVRLDAIFANSWSSYVAYEGIHGDKEDSDRVIAGIRVWF